MLLFHTTIARIERFEGAAKRSNSSRLAVFLLDRQVICFPLVTLSVQKAWLMCFVGVALKGGGGIFWFESRQTEGEIASFEKLAYPSFNNDFMIHNSIFLYYFTVKLLNLLQFT